MGTALVPRSARPHVALSDAWRHYLVPPSARRGKLTPAGPSRYTGDLVQRVGSSLSAPRLPTDLMPPTSTDVRLDVQLGRLRLANPITVASGTFGYGREMAGLVDVSRLGGILPKTITAAAAGRQSAPAHRRNHRRHAQFHRAGQRRRRGVHPAAVALPGLARHGRDRQHRRKDPRASTFSWPAGSTASRASAPSS